MTQNLFVPFKKKSFLLLRRCFHCVWDAAPVCHYMGNKSVRWEAQSVPLSWNTWLWEGGKRYILEGENRILTARTFPLTPIITNARCRKETHQYPRRHGLIFRLHPYASATLASQGGGWMWLDHFEFKKQKKNCVNLVQRRLMGGQAMKNKTLVLVSGASDLVTRLHSVSRVFFVFWNWKHLGGRCITYLNATRHISVYLNIPIYSKTVSALLKWIMDGKSRLWVISYDTIMFCLCQHLSLWDCYNLARESWARLTDLGAETFLPPT